MSRSSSAGAWLVVAVVGVVVGLVGGCLVIPAL